MKKTVKCMVILLLGLSIQQIAIGQSVVSKITLNHNGNSTFYSVLNDAVTASASGDTIYLPGGPVNVSGNVTINKTLTIVGAGHYPDSTVATNPSLWTSSGNYVLVIQGADNGSISGIKNLSVYFGNGIANSANVNNFRIERCYLSSLNFNYNNNSGYAQNIYVAENIIGSFSNPASVLFEKNIFTYYSSYPNPYTAVFNNNIFYTNNEYYYGGFNWGANSVFSNNVIVEVGSNTNTNGGTNCVYNNNLFCRLGSSGASFSCGSTNQCNDNITGKLASETFQNALTTGFSYSNNYHLQPTSQGVNGGTDGRDIGLYGTAYPYKDGAVPFNPHISSKNINTSTSTTGKLGVDVKVSAQDR
jgi:hypothetical protein